MSDWLSVLEGAGLSLLVKGDIYKFVSTVFGGTAEQVTEFVNNEVRYFNAQRTAQAFAKVYKTLEEEGIQPQRIRRKILIPLLEGISFEDEDENLQQKWINLLTSAVIGGSISPSYSSILNDLSPLDVKVLDTINKLKNATGKRKISEVSVLLELSSELGFGTAKVRIKDALAAFPKSEFSYQEIKQIEEGKELISESLDNLIRLSLVEGKGRRQSGLFSNGQLSSGVWGYKEIELSSLGVRFLKIIGKPNQS